MKLQSPCRRVFEDLEIRSRSCWRLLLVAFAFAGALLPQLASGQPSPMLYAQTIKLSSGGLLEFTFRDDGTGATNYVAEFSAEVGPGATWIADPAATISSLGNGAFRVQIPNPMQPNGFYRILALRPSGGPVVANFAATQLQVTEGGMVSAVITFSAPYTGLIRYTITGTAKDDEYQPLSGELRVNNSMNAFIPVALTENTSVDELRYLSLRLEQGAGFELGSAADTRVIIDDNDAEWHGTIGLGAATLGFLMSIDQNALGRTARIRSDPAGIFPLEPVDSTLVFTENDFASTTPDIQLEAASNLFMTPAKLTLHLSAQNGIENQLVSSNNVEGAAILITEYEGKSYLNRTNHGSFNLYKPPVRPSSQPVKLTQAP
jgi:hypothetical protein